MQIPLHIRPDDMSPAAYLARVQLHREMAALNPKGFRTPRSATRLRAKVRKGKRHLRSVEPAYRIDMLTLAVRLARGDAIMRGVNKVLGHE